MPLYRKMKSPLGYQNLTNSFLDSYGVDHSAFTTRDELEYQFARQERENLLMDQEKQNGVTDNFTQYGHNFWGTPSENNFGFGSSNISENIERLQKTFKTPPSSTSNFFDQSLIEQPQQNSSRLDLIPTGYQSLLSDDESNSFLEESSSYPTSSYNSLTSSSPQSFGQTFVQAPATSSLTGGLNSNAFDLRLNNFSYPNALGTGGGTLTERMAATLKAREMPYNSLSGDTTSSMSELSGNSFNSLLSSDFSNNNPHQNDPLWQELSSYSIDQLNELGELIKKAKEEERLYGSSPIKQSLLDHLFAIKQAHASTLSSMGIENRPISMPSDEVLRADFEVYWPKMQGFENTVLHPYIDSNCYDTAGTGHLMNLKDLKNDPLIDFSDPKKREAYLALSNKIKKEICEQGADGKWHTNKTREWQSDKFKDLENYPVDEKTDKEIAFKHIKNRLPQVLKLFSIQNPPIDWDSLPVELKIPWFDIMVNPGVNTPIYNFKTHKTGWPKLAKAYALKDWETAKKELERKGVGTLRTKELADFIEAGIKKLNQ